MSLRAKLLLLFFACGVAPMLLLSIVNYTNSVRTIKRLVRRDAEERARRIARAFEESLRDRETNLNELARASSLREFVKNSSATNLFQKANLSSGAIPDDVRADVGSFFRDYRDYYAAITCLDAAGRPLFRVANSLPNANRLEAIFQTGEDAVDRLTDDVRVWNATSPTAKNIMHSAVAREPFGAGLRYIVPILDGETPRGAIVADIKLNALFHDAESGYVEAVPSVASFESGDVAINHYSVVLDSNGQIMHHTNGALRFQSILSAMPYFASVADEMKTAARGGEGAGTKFFADADGKEWLAAYRPIGDLHLAIAVVENYSRAVEGLRRAGLFGVACSILITGIAALFLISLVNRLASRIAVVARAASNIAEGEFEQTITVRANDETRTLAESFNRMSARLREMIAREAESKQFEAFMRISAMLTHDLKNSIGALGLLVKNIERQASRSNFEEATTRGLRATTESLRGLVARLSDPARILRDEKSAARSRVFDIVPLLRKVLAQTTGDAKIKMSGANEVQKAANCIEREDNEVEKENFDSFYTLEANLPDSPLFVRGDAERLEKVFENLIVNAKEAMNSEDGQLKIAAGESDAREIFVTIADNGCGMSEEFQRARLFRPFATTKERGIGLGLYTCREIIEAHGGRIEVESKIGVGTAFRIVLPSAQNSALE